MGSLKTSLFGLRFFFFFLQISVEVDDIQNDILLKTIFSALSTVRNSFEIFFFIEVVVWTSSQRKFDDSPVWSCVCSVQQSRKKGH